MATALSAGMTGDSRLWSRRQVLGALAALGTAGCAYSPVLKMAAESFGLGEENPAYPVSREYIDQLPYATLGARVGKGPWAVLVLARYDGPSRQWVSADRATVVTRHGRLTKTAGLGRDLRATVFYRPDPLAQDPQRLHGAALQRGLDIEPDDFGLLAESDFAVEGPEEIRILDRPVQTLRVRERVQLAHWRWSAVNHYWIDRKSGLVWRSVQAWCPDQPPLTLEVLKPAA